MKRPRGYQGMTEFERHLVKKEEMERMEAKEHYSLGIQGVDGGKCYSEAEEPHKEPETYS